MAYTEFDGALDHEQPGYVEFNGELDKPESTTDKVKSTVSKGIDAGLSLFTPKKSIADQAQDQSASLASTAAPQVSGVPIRLDYYNKAVAETSKGSTVPDTGIVSRVRNIAANDKQGQLGKRTVANAFTSTEPDEGIGLLGTLKEGAIGTARNIGAAIDTVQGNAGDVVSAASDAKSDEKDPALESLLNDINARKKALGENPGWIDSIKAVGGAAINNPKGAGLLVAEQLPNSATALGAGAAGMAAGSVFGPAGAIAGGIAGLFGANTALETGGKAIEAATDGTFSPTEQSRVLKEGAIKGGVITGIDAATLGLTNFIMGTTARAVERATVKTLADHGVDVSNKAAVLAASKNPAIVSAVQSSQKLAQAASSTLGQKIARVGGATGLETVGEGAGEYLGEMAATGKADKVDAVIEALSSLGQSAGEIAFTAARNKAKLSTIAGKPVEQLSDSILKYTTNRGSERAKAAAQAELNRRANEGVDEAVANAPETLMESVDRRIATGKDKADEIRSRAPDAIQSNVLDEPGPNPADNSAQDVYHVGNANSIKLPDHIVDGNKMVEQDSVAQSQPAPDAPTPEPIQTLSAQLNALAAGNKPGMLLTPGEPMPHTLPPGVKAAEVPGRGTLLYRDDATLQAAMNGQMGTALGYGIDEKPVTDQVVTARDANGAVIQDVATDGRPEVAQAAAALAGPNGSVEVRPVQDAMVERGQNNAHVVLPDNSHLPAKWDVVDADSVSASLKQGVNQPRDRSRAASDIQVQGIANNPDYRRLSDSPVMDVGAPTLGHDGAIVGGNGRFEGISRAYDQGSAGHYLASLKADAAAKGIDPAKIDGMKKPVLVRRITEPFDTRKLAVASNSGTGMQYSGLELAKIDAERMKGLADLEVTDSGDIALTGSNIQNALHALSDYNAAELGSLVDKDGRLSQEGVRRIRNAMLYSAYGNNPTLERLVESTDNDLRNISAALIKASGLAAKVRADIQSGALPTELDISADLVGAVETLSKIRAQGMTVYEYLAQIGMFGEETSEASKELMRILEANIRSQKKIADFIKSYYDAVLRLDLSSGDMFGASVPTKPELLSNAKERITEKQPVAQDLFARPARAADAESRPQSANNESASGSGEKDQVNAPKAEPVHPLRPLVESLIKRLAAAKQGGKDLSNAIARAKEVMDGKRTDATVENRWFRLQAKAFEKADQEAAGILRQIGEAAKAKESSANSPKFSRAPSKQDVEFAHDFLVELSDVDELFRYPVSHKTSLKGVFEEVYPGATYVGDGTRVDERDESGADHRYVFKSPQGKQFYVYERDNGEVFIDVSNFSKGEGGQAVYAAVANWAYNTKRKFIGDPAGLTADSLIRRTSNMLSSAIRFGTTRHLEAAPQQIAGDLKNGVPPLDWSGDDVAKIRALIHTFVTTLDNKFPQLKSYRYDFATRQFVDRRGRPVGPDRFTYAEATGMGGSARAGKASMRRGILIQSLISSEGSERPGLLEQVLDGSRAFVLRGKLEGIFSRPKQNQESQKATHSGGLSVSDEHKSHVQVIVDAIRGGWKNAPEIVVVDDMTDPAIPERVRSANAQQMSQGAIGQPEGFFYKGKVYIVASEMRSPADVVRVIFHETLGHYGLRGVFGDELKPILKQIAALRRADVEKKAKQYGLDMSIEKDRLIAAEEVLAEMAQTNPQISFVRRAIAAIRAWLRQNIPALADMKMTDDEIIHSYLIPAREFVMKGKGAGANGLTAFSRQSQTETQAFKKWFGDSKVVGEDGKPLVVYHGTHNDFSEFKTADGITGRGIYLGSARHANVYADKYGRDGGRVMPVYVSMKNPLAIYDSAVMENDPRVLAAKKHPGLFDGKDPLKLSMEETTAYIRKAGYDGIIHYEGLPGQEHTNVYEYVAFEPEQIKSAIGNRGTYDPNNGDIRFSRKPGSTFDSPEPSRLDTILHALQDKNIDLKRVTEAIKKTGKQIADNINAYLQEELFHGRSAARVKEFIDTELDPLIKLMRVNGVKMADFEEYLWARHAEERNKQIAKINPNMPDGGSGMSTKDALDYLAGLDPKQKALYDSLAKRVDAINRKSRQVLVDYGLESQKTIDTWEAAYKHYVPLMREDMDHAFGNGTGQGFSIKGNSAKRATGSKRPVVDILANIAQQREKYIIRGEKNRVATALIGLAKENPNPDFWKVDTPPVIRDVNKSTGLVEERTDPNYKSRDNVIVARIPDSKGNIQERSVVFNEHDPRALRMAMSLKNLDQDEVGAVLNASSIITRYFASINTQYNPIFGIVNLTRDVQGAMLNLTSTPLAGKKKVVISRTGPALLAIYQSVRGIRKGNAVNNQWAQLWEEFQKEGGKTGFRDMYKNAQDRAEALEKGLNPDWWQTTRVGKVITAGGLLNAPEKVIADKAVKPLFDWLSDYNDSMENAVRLAAYKTGLEQGLSKQQAASLAKNLTVNFNKRGAAGRQIGALYAFFNASVQGTARLAETIKGPAGKRIVTGGILLGGMQAMLLAMAGMGDDEPPEFVKSRSLIIPIGDGKYLSVPMPLGFNVLPNIGRITAEFVMSGFKDPAKRTIQMMDSVLDAFNPVGNAGMSLQTISPTAIDPLAALAENKDWTGKPIARQDFNSMNPTPGFTRAKDTASVFSKLLAEGINTLSGGTKYQPGALSPTPDQIDYLISQATGGVGREYLKAEQTVTSGFTGEELPPHKVPLLGRFYGDTKGQSSQGAEFYDNLKRLNGHEAEIKGRIKNREDVAEYKRDNPEWALIGDANSAEKRVQELRKRKRELVEQGAPKERIKMMDEVITATMKSLNEKVRQKTSSTVH